MRDHCPKKTTKVKLFSPTRFNRFGEFTPERSSRMRATNVPWFAEE
jgi:hypothetical protein